MPSLNKISQLKAERSEDKCYFHFKDSVFIWRRGDSVVSSDGHIWELESDTLQAAKRKIFELQRGEELV